ncbi:MAG: DUF5686 family protein [Bacteroidetes bacterium]|nr:DUF5686 family protein [Bacteroidota bacterium]
MPNNHPFPIGRWICLIGLMVNAYGLSAQITEVSGHVFDAVTGDPLPYVNVVLVGAGTGTMTNEKGRYSLSTENRPGRLTATFLGYSSQSFEVTRGAKQRIDISLEPKAFDLGAAEVRPNKKEKNPAKPFMQRVIEAKERNNPQSLNEASHQVHARMEVDINDLTDRQINAWYWGSFDFIFDYIDYSEPRVALPVLFGEFVAEEQWTSSPKKKQTQILATQVSGKLGSGGDMAASEMNSRFPEINLYENHLLMLDRVFTSPLHDRASAHYRFYILDTLDRDGRATMRLAFVPRRKGEMTFEGELLVDTMSLALVEVDARLSPGANINYVRDMQWKQSYIPVASEEGLKKEERWMLSYESILFDLSIADRSIGAYMRRTNSFDKHQWGTALASDSWRGGRDLQFDSLATQRTDQEWDSLRIQPLLPRESNISVMTDSVTAKPQWRLVKGAGYFLGTGYILTGPLELGAWWSSYTTNPTEGQRFRLDVRTSNAFSTRFMPSVFGAYGTYDHRWKGGFSARQIMRKSPRTEAYIEFKRDLEQFGMAGLLNQGEAFTSAFRTDTTNLLSEVHRAEASIFHEFGPGFTGFVEWRHRQVRTSGTWEFLDPSTALPIDRLVTSEVTGIVRYARGERFVGGEFDRFSLGTEWPILTANVTWGIPNILGSQYQYLRCTLEGEDEIRLGWWGQINWIAQAGRYFGSAPFPLLEAVPTSGTIIMTPESFNMLRVFENVTDQWVMGSVEWHGEGILLNHIPLIRRLGFREVLSAKGIQGSWDSKHESLLALPDGTTGLNGSYIEYSAGLENILKVIRIDGVWRADKPLSDPDSWGIRIGISADI